MDNTKCLGEHDIYVAEVIGVESFNRVVVVTVCRHCDRVSFHEHDVGGNMRLLKEEEKEKSHAFVQR